MKQQAAPTPPPSPQLTVGVEVPSLTLLDPLKLSLGARDYPTFSAAVAALRDLEDRLVADLSPSCHLEIARDSAAITGLAPTYRTGSTWAEMRIGARFTDFRSLEERQIIHERLLGAIADPAITAIGTIRLVNWVMAPLVVAVGNRGPAFVGAPYWSGSSKVSADLPTRIAAFGEIRAARLTPLAPYLDGRLPVTHLDTFRLLHVDEPDDRAYILTHLANSPAQQVFEAAAEPMRAAIIAELVARRLARISPTPRYAAGKTFAARSLQLARRITAEEALFLPW